MVSEIVDAVDFYDRLGRTQWYRSMFQSLVHWIGIHDRFQVLDAGCGVPRFAMYLAQRANWVTVLDTSEYMLRRGREIAEQYGMDNLTYVQGDIRRMPFEDASFDLVFCVNVLFLFDKPDKPFAELARVLKPSGRLVVVGPGPELNPWTSLKYANRHKLWDFERDSLVSWATAASRKRIQDQPLFESLAARHGLQFVDAQLLLDGLAAGFVMWRPGPKQRLRDAAVEKALEEMARKAAEQAAANAARADAGEHEDSAGAAASADPASDASVSSGAGSAPSGDA